MRFSFAKKLTASYLVVVAVTLLLSGAFLATRLQKEFLRQLEQSLAAQAILIAENFPAKLPGGEAAASLQREVQHYGQKMGFRVTAIRKDGTVVGDSERTLDEVTKMDNHLSRPEVARALGNGLGESQRYSATLHENLLYVAVPVKTTAGNLVGILRVALPLTEVHRRLRQLWIDLAKAGVAAMVVALLIALLSVRKISRPLVRLTEAAKAIGQGRTAEIAATVRSRDEFGQLASTLSDMSAKIEEKVGELSRERAQLSAILSALIEGVVALDHQGRILLLNPAAERLFGVTSESVRGRPFLEGLRHSPLNEVLTQTISTHQPQKKEISLHADEDRTIAIHTQPVNYGEGRTGVLAALHDITELRRLATIRQEFVANVSHELKTPLTSIKGYVETLLDGAIDDPKHNRDFLKTIDDHAENLRRLIDDLLDLSAIEAKRVTYRMEPFSLAEVAERIMLALDPMAKTRKIKLVNQLKSDLPKILADRDKVAQILINLIDNAIKFNKDGGKVVLSATSRDGALIVTVEDSGAGIAPEDLPRIFERFFRADRSHSHTVKGTGLGLAIVKHLVEAHRGTVTARSLPDQGSTFTFTLPLA
jgi:two-component system, OmpR family, phosphate regulon sensor histidine kinase PhoR